MTIRHCSIRFSADKIYVEAETPTLSSPLLYDNLSDHLLFIPRTENIAVLDIYPFKLRLELLKRLSKRYRTSFLTVIVLLLELTSSKLGHELDFLRLRLLEVLIKVHAVSI